MYSWRITKYDPLLRRNGIYQREEWTSFYEVGKVIDGKMLSFSEYFQIESAYVHAVLTIMDYLNISALQMEALEKYNTKWEVKNNSMYPETLIELLHTAYDGQLVPKAEIGQLVRLNLRENIWCKLENDRMFVHFGYDYYMYVGSLVPCSEVMKKFHSQGLFVEAYPSPYL
jgi:hypothetical protein